MAKKEMTRLEKLEALRDKITLFEEDSKAWVIETPDVIADTISSLGKMAREIGEEKGEIKNGTKIMFDIGEGLHKGFATVVESKQDEDDNKHTLYKLDDIECTTANISMHFNESNELWVNDFEVIKIPDFCLKTGLEM